LPPTITSFGIEGIRYFGNARAAGFDADNMRYVFNICNGLDRELRDAGHQRKFYWGNDNCWEIDLRDVTSGGGGIDHQWADSADLFFILTHGRNDDGNAQLLYNIETNQWVGNSSTWKLGNQAGVIPFPFPNQLEWLLIYGCKTIDKNNVFPHAHIFQRLHEFCGAYGDMWDSVTTDEVGEEVGENLTDGDTVANAWLDGVSDWFFDNHPMVVAAERKETYNNGDVIWSETTLNNDHIWGHGLTVPDIFPADLYYLSYIWEEG
jgi:hypothetical protein